MELFDFFKGTGKENFELSDLISTKAPQKEEKY